MNANKIKQVRTTVTLLLSFIVVLIFFQRQTLQVFILQMKVTYGTEKVAIEALEESVKFGPLALPVLKAGIKRESLRRRTVVFACNRDYMIWVGRSNTLRLRTAEELQNGAFANVEIDSFVVRDSRSGQYDFSGEIKFLRLTTVTDEPLQSKNVDYN